MKKRTVALCTAIIELMTIFGTMTAYAEEDKDMSKYIVGFEKMKNETLPKIDSLIKDCEGKKIFVDYEKSDYRIIEKFIDIGINDATREHKTAVDRGVTLSEVVGYGDETKANDKTERSKYIYDTLIELAVKTEKSLNSYLDNSATPVGKVLKYKTSKVTTDGFSFVAENENNEKKPVFFTGYGHFGEAMTDIPIFSDMGVNIIEVELGPKFVMELAEDGNFVFNPKSEYFVKLMEVFDEAAKYNVGINLLLSPHYMPGWFYEKFPKQVSGEYFNSSEEMKKLLAAYVKGVMGIVKEKPALNSVCLTNEPAYTTANEEYELPLYIDFLKKRYNNIASLNKCYSTEYASFDKIAFPDKAPLYEPNNEENRKFLPCIWDYIEFNDEYFANVHEYLYNLVHGAAPEVLVGAKVMQDFDCDERDWRRNFLLYGSNVENIGKFLTISGNDANNYYDPQDYQWDILNKMSYYDLQSSIRKAPVFDFEDHVIRDRNDVYGEQIMVDHVAADMWQGAIHGRGGTTIWTWERSYDDSHDFSGSILNRPDVVAENSKTMLDINRLADEITMLENAPKKIGILYSRTARIYSKYNSNAVTKAYEAASFTGERVDFVTEKQAVDGKLKNSCIELLIVPVEEYLIEGTAEAVVDYIKNGGKVMIMGKDSFSKNQYNNEINSETRKYIFDNSTIVDVKVTGEDQILEPTSKDIWTKACNIIGNDGVKLVDSKTGENVYGISYTYVLEDGAVILNICNYDYDNEKTVNVIYNDRKITDGIELRSMRKIPLSQISVKPIEPLLIRFEDGLYIDTLNHWSNSDVKSLWEKGITSTSKTFEPDEKISVEEFLKLSQDAFDIDTKELSSLIGEKQVFDRETMAVIAVEICRQRKTELRSKPLDGFTDAKEVKEIEAIQYAVGSGLFSGTPEMTLLPKQAATKAEAVAVINRIFNLR